MEYKTYTYLSLRVLNLDFRFSFNYSYQGSYPDRSEDKLVISEPYFSGIKSHIFNENHHNAIFIILIILNDTNIVLPNEKIYRVNK